MTDPIPMLCWNIAGRFCPPEDTCSYPMSCTHANIGRLQDTSPANDDGERTYTWLQIYEKVWHLFINVDMPDETRIDLCHKTTTWVLSQGG